MSFRKNRESAYASPPLSARVVEGFFAFNGASDPISSATTMSGTIAAVRRLTSTGGTDFYRVRFEESTIPPSARDSRFHLDVAVESDYDGAQVLSAGFPPEGGLDGAVDGFPNTDEIDIVILDAGVATNSVPAATPPITQRVSFSLLYDDRGTP